MVEVFTIGSSRVSGTMLITISPVARMLSRVSLYCAPPLAAVFGRGPTAKPSTGGCELHTLKKLAPDREFIHVTPFLRCPNMKKITLEKIVRSLETLEPRVTVEDAVAAGARRAIEGMLAVVSRGA